MKSGEAGLGLGQRALMRTPPDSSQRCESGSRRKASGKAASCCRLNSRPAMLTSSRSSSCSTTRGHRQVRPGEGYHTERTSLRSAGGLGSKCRRSRAMSAACNAHTGCGQAQRSAALPHMRWAGTCETQAFTSGEASSAARCSSLARAAACSTPPTPARQESAAELAIAAAVSALTCVHCPLVQHVLHIPLCQPVEALGSWRQLARVLRGSAQQGQPGIGHSSQLCRCTVSRLGAFTLQSLNAGSPHLQGEAGQHTPGLPSVVWPARMARPVSVT